MYFLNNLVLLLSERVLLLSAEEKVLSSFKSRLFLIKNLDKIPTR